MTRGEVRENLLVAWDTLRAHKIRSALTVLGIVIGVTSVIAVAAIIQGLNGYIQGRVEGLGSHTYFVSRIPFGGGRTGGMMPEKIRTRKYIQPGDAARLKEMCPSIKSATVFGTRAFFMGDSNEIRYGSEHVERIFVRGVEPEFADAIPLFAVAQGRFISRYDLDHARPVVVLGMQIADSLFPHSDPMGKTVRLNGSPYEVIGVFEHDPGMFGGSGVDQFAIIPFSDFHARYPEVRELALAFTVPPDVDIQRAKDEVTDAMRRIRKVPFKAENDFELISPDFLSDLWNQLTGALVLLTGIISSIGLLVGGIGVMNIMLISVTERTAEIGVRKAIGARRSDIRVQFLSEAVMVTLVGGVIGIMAGAAIAFAVHALIPGVPAKLSPMWVVLGVAISTAVGLFFGFYPANRAANLDPIVCLRYE
jgi:putative ABC transport system permease protein